MIGWPVSWPNEWLMNWLAAWPSGVLIGRMFGRAVYCSNDVSIGQVAGGWLERFDDWSIDMYI